MKRLFFSFIIGLLVNWVIGIYWIIRVFPSFAWATAPLLKIVSPSEGQTILGDEITISFIVSEVNIGPEGHLHLWFDSEIEEATTASEIATHFDHTLSQIPPGPHKLTLEVVKSDHTSFSPIVKETVHFVTRLPLNPSPTEIPKPKILSFTSEISWQAYTTILGIFILLIGIFIRYKWRKP